MRILFVMVCGLLFPVLLNAQSVKGKITDTKNNPLPGASLIWLGTTIGTSSDNKGKFELPLDTNNNKLIASYNGFSPDTLDYSGQQYLQIKLHAAKSLNEVIVRGSRPGIFLPNAKPFKLEVITQTELKKAACCDLAGCFETQASVQPTTTNIVTNSKELRVLGISGIYNQVLIDGMPLIQGLSYTYGISSIPGTLIDNIYVSKGANSVLQGFESISGQINVETKEPDNTDKLLLNGYINNFGEKQFNVNYAIKGKGWSDLISFHTVQPANKTDGDHDTFLDVPLLTRYSFFNKLKYGNDRDWGWSSRIGVGYLNEQRIGGQTFFNPETDKGTMNAYGQVVNISQPELWTKTSYKLNDENKFTIIASSLYQDQTAYFGTTLYKANQTSLYANLQYELTYNEKQNLKVGISYRYFILDENINFLSNPLNKTYAGNYNKLDNIPGIFAENTFTWFNDKVVLLTGLRADHHQTFGSYLTPRALIKYEPIKNSIFRASIGTGWRTVNIFSENINLLASSRNVVFEEPLKPEKALNYGASFTQKFDGQNIEGYFSADYYRTDFQNQIFPDYDTDPNKIIIANFFGKSVSNAYQVEAGAQFLKTWELKLAYSYLDVYRIQNGSKYILPFNPKNTLLATLSYKPVSAKWHIDLNAHWFGIQQLPNTDSKPEPYRRPQTSDPYTLVNGQFTKTWKIFEFYAGAENIFNFRQNQPILGWQDPFGKYFDTSSAWGPIRGREMYLGIRFMVH